MVKAHNRIDWENYPKEVTSMGDTNMNNLDASLDEQDNRVIIIDAIKAGLEGKLDE